MQVKLASYYSKINPDGVITEGEGYGLSGFMCHPVYPAYYTAMYTEYVHASRKRA